LKILGFSNLSGDLGIVKGDPFNFRNSIQRQYYGISMVPATCGLNELSAAIDSAKESGDDSIIVVVMHPYDFAEYGGTSSITIDFLNNMLKTVASDEQLITKRIRDIDKKLLNHNRYSSASRYVLLQKIAKIFIPRPALSKMGFVDLEVGHWLENGRYMNETNYNKLYMKMLLMLLVKYTFIGMIIGLVIFHFTRKKLINYFIIISFFSTTLLSLVLLEYKKEIITSPNMSGVLILFLIFIISIHATVLIAKRYYDKSNLIKQVDI
jgi:hypothetical protein